MTGRQALLRAADYIEEKGWVQHQFGKPGFPCCAVTALRIVCGSNPTYGTKRPSSAEKLLAGNLGWTPTSRITAEEKISRWNDSLDPTEGGKTVIRRMRRVAGGKYK